MVSAWTSCLELAESEQYHSVKTAARSEPPGEEKHLLTVRGVSEGRRVMNEQYETLSWKNRSLA